MLLDDNSIWRDIRSNVSCSDVAEHYSMGMNKKGFMLCPFHNDSRPSLKVYNGTERDEHSGFYCFSCGKHGSVIDLVSGYFGISPRESVELLARDYGISQTARSGTTPPKPKTNWAKKFESDILHWIRIIADLKEIISKQSEDAFRALEKPHSEADEERCSCLCDRVTRLESIMEILTEGNKTEQMDMLVSWKGELEEYERELQRYSCATQKAV